MLCGSLNGRGVWARWTHVYAGWVPSLCPWNYYNIVNWLTLTQNKKLKKTGRKIYEHIGICTCVSECYRVRPFKTPWTVVHQTTLSIFIVRLKISWTISQGYSHLPIISNIASLNSIVWMYHIWFKKFSLLIDKNGCLTTTYISNV